MDNNTILIDRYLQNEMSREEREAFENTLKTDKRLQEELRVQKLLVAAALDNGIKSEFSKAYRQKVIHQRMLTWTVAGVVILGALIFLAVRMGLFSGKHRPESFKRGTEPAEQFRFDNTRDTVIETKDGVVFAIPAGAFQGGNTIQLEIQTALTPYDIMDKGLSTISNGSLLQTAGMFYINGYENEKPVSLAKDIAVSVPAYNRDPNMQLFDGVDDGKGGINWVNPKPVEKDLITYDITQLDFYPTNYIPVLKVWGKDFANKQYTDSLYYSFSGHPYYDDQRPVTIDNTEAIPGESKDVNDTSDTDYDYITDHDYKDTGKVQLDSVSHKQIEDHFDKIDPAKIKAIWDKKFNNTILATKEFEERLRFLHSVSNSEPADLLAIYVNNLDKPLYVSDELCAKAAKDAHLKEQMLAYAARKDGSVKVADEIQQQLAEYFQERSAAYREAARKAWEKYEDELLRLTNEASTRKTDQARKDLERVQKLFDEEYCINLTDAYRQIGVQRNCNDTIPVQPIPQETYEVTISSTGWKNLDIYVFDATTNRESMNYTDPVTGKTATLSYEELNIRVEGQTNYDRVLVYLVPDSLSSFQRMEQVDDVFKEKLNALFRYDLFIIGYKGTEIFYHRVRLIKPGDHQFKLLPTTKESLLELLKEYNKIKAVDIKEEIEFQVAELQELKRVVQARKDYDFREHISWAIFCCSEGSYNNFDRRPKLDSVATRPVTR